MISDTLSIMFFNKPEMHYKVYGLGDNMSTDVTMVVQYGDSCGGNIKKYTK